eukprot:403355972
MKQGTAETTVDPQGFMTYSPDMVSCSSTVTSTPEGKHLLGSTKDLNKRISNSKSIFAKFFIIEDGIISLSLRDMTIACSATISIGLLVMLYFSCNNNDFECTWTDFPMVSTVIALHMYDRAFIILTTILMFGVQQVNIRAFYKKLYGKISDSQNDRLLNLGIISCAALPLIGVFDEHQWGTIHGICAVLFFGCFGVYCILLGKYLADNKAKFNPIESDSIDKLQKGANFIIVILSALGLSMLYYHAHGPTPIIEWITVLYYANFFSIASYANGFYDSVHEDGNLVPVSQERV